MIDVKNLKKTYKINIKEPGIKGSLKNLLYSEWKEKVAIEDISFNMSHGQAMACIGENGAGKSTLIKMLIGILNPTAGKVKVFGKLPREDKYEYLKNIGVIFGQKTNLWVDIPVIESYNAMQVIYKIEKSSYKQNLDRIVETLELQDILNSPARKLSLGQRMKADIGMVFLHNPKLLYLDEPTIGLDINVKHTIRKFIRGMNKEMGTSIFLTSHDLDDIEEICDTTIILSKGKIFYDGSLEQLHNNYIKTKTVEITGNVKGDISILLPGTNINYDGKKTKIIYETQKYDSKEILDAVFNSFDIEDINISEPNIEEVVSKIFSSGSKE